MTTTMLQSHDGVRIAAEACGDGPITFVVAHGLTGHRGRTGVRRITDWLAQHGRVVVFDQRGHGESSGQCTLAYREPMDLDAVVAWARSLSSAPVVTIGFSMGASVVIRHAALTSGAERPEVDTSIDVHHRPDATVVVSGVGQWFFRGTRIMDRLYLLTAFPVGRLLFRWRSGVTLSVRDWAGPKAPEHVQPLTPTASAAAIRHPLLIVHGTEDHYFPESHAERVYAAAAGNSAAELWVEPGMGHAERATSADLIDRIATWASRAVLDVA